MHKLYVIIYIILYCVIVPLVMHCLNAAMAVALSASFMLLETITAFDTASALFKWRHLVSAMVSFSLGMIGCPILSPHCVIVLFFAQAIASLTNCRERQGVMASDCAINSARSFLTKVRQFFFQLVYCHKKSR